ncbi:hypothetical protein [Poritiphilus flavus]|uniref:Uncharacterized protein n=1 Tax=Poritiphilus flavus TaxID=2697053 RepID=A0A6L9E7Y8_9FLAO|nr:hypothetical protein [Poritiphilus flavus]NAS10754.1 hypothetical protein [Poritiphilus flavus]
MKKKFILSLLIACGIFYVGMAQEAASNTANMKEVMGLHDEVMEEMPKLVRLIGQLETKAQNSSDSQKYLDAIDDLKKANTSMMSWMEGFGKRFTADEMYKNRGLTAQKQQWLVEEKKKVIELREEIYGSLKQANSVLEEK